MKFAWSCLVIVGIIFGRRSCSKCSNSEVVASFHVFNKQCHHHKVLLPLVQKLGSRTIETIRGAKSRAVESPSSLFVSIGLGPDDSSQQQQEEEEEERELVAGVDYEIPDHEAYRKSRRSKLDEQCDQWFQNLLGDDNLGILGELAKDARQRLTTPVELKNEFQLPKDDKDWTPFVSTKLPWTPLTPAFGLEEFGLPVPRRNAEAWRHFDVVSMVQQDYSGSPDGVGKDLELSPEQIARYQICLKEKGGWLEDNACLARLVYINGRHVPQLSKATDNYRNLRNLDELSNYSRSCLGRLTDGFTDELAVPLQFVDGDSGESVVLSSFKKLSGPDHCLGDATSQFAINTQQGTACFAALNTVRTGAVAYIHVPSPTTEDEAIESDATPQPIMIVNCITTLWCFVVFVLGIFSQFDTWRYHPTRFVQV